MIILICWQKININYGACLNYMMEKIDNFNSILKSFNIKACCVDFNKINNYFYYDLTLNPSTKVTDINKYADEISLALKTPNKPNVKILHNEGLVRLEFLTPRDDILKLFDLFSNKSVPQGDLLCLLGESIDGNKVWMDLAKNPHLIIAGTTGSGKSTLLHNIIANIINYNDASIFLVDPKNIEFAPYTNKFSSVKIFNSYNESLNLLNYLIEIMNKRYSMMRADINLKIKPIVIIIDEVADLIMQDKNNQLYTSLCILAQKCRAAKIHIILATQRPSVNIINGTIKANFPARIACKVSSHVDSKIILDATGAQNLLGNGDALIRDNFRTLERFQVAYTNAVEVCNNLSN